LTLIFGATTLMHGEDLRGKYIGRSSCAAELKAATDRYGIRLDRTQKAYLEADRLANANILLLVQRTNDGDKCGTVRDVVESRRIDDDFIWECVDHAALSDVVVGTWAAKHRSTSGPADEAWRIDSAKLKFIPIHRTVNCTNPSYAGNDEGDSLSDWARKRAKRQQVKKR